MVRPSEGLSRGAQIIGSPQARGTFPNTAPYKTPTFRLAELDRTLSRAWKIFLEDLGDETDAELSNLLPPLVDAAYVAIDSESPTGHFWRFTPTGVQQAEALGLG